MPATFMTVGFNATSALLTWRLSQSNLYNVYTYWPTNEVTFTTDIFGKGPSTFVPNQLDIQNLPPGTPRMNIVLLVINSIKDVSRMCKKIQPVIDKRTLILVDVSGGTGPLQQRLVRPQLSKNQVVGIICDFKAVIVCQQQPKFEVHQYGDSSSTGPKPGCYIEPVAPKITATLATALQSCGIPVQHPKNVASFGALQWERCITVVVFELLGVALGKPTVEDLVGDVVAKPIIDGLIGELTSIAQAAGVKGLPSKSQFVKSSSTLVRRAPTNFPIKNATWLFSEYYNKHPLPLDFLLLLPIVLTDELSKSGPTPYLESLYAFTSHLVSVNDRPSILLTRNLGQAQSSGVSEETTKRAKDLEAAEATLARVRRELKDQELSILQREKESELREESMNARLAKLEEQKASIQQHEANIQQHIQTQVNAEVAKVKQEMEQTIQQQVQLRSSAAIAKAKEEMTVESRASSRTSSSGSGPDSDREQLLEQRERMLERRERAIIQRERQQQASRPSPNGMPSPNPNAMAPNNGRRLTGSVPNGNVPNGGMPNGVPPPMPISTPRSNSQPWIGPNGMTSPPNGLPRGRHHSIDQQAPRAPMSPPLPRSSTNLAGMLNDFSFDGANRSSRRSMSRAQSVSSVNIYEPPSQGSGSRSRPSLPNSALFSQQLQLDGIMSLANDRYGMVSRSTRGNNAALSADHQPPRPFSHGGHQPVKSKSNYSPNGNDGYNDFGSGSGSGGSSGSVNSVKPRRSPGQSPPRDPSYDAYRVYDSAEQQWNAGSGNSQSTLPRSRTGTPPTPQMGDGPQPPAGGIPKLAPIESYPLEFAL